MIYEIRLRLCWPFSQLIEQCENGSTITYPFLTSMWQKIHEQYPVKMIHDLDLLPGDLEAMGIKE